MPSRFGIRAEIAFIFAIILAGYFIHQHVHPQTLADVADAKWGAIK